MSAGGIGKYDLNAGDQRPSKQELAEAQQAHERYDAGKDGSHKANDPKDERSIANRLAAAEPQNDEGENASDVRPTEIARSHGNEPSKGAKIDEQLELEEEAELRKKGKLP